MHIGIAGCGIGGLASAIFLKRAGLTPVYQSDSWLLPAFRDHAVPLIASLPPFPRILANIIAGHIGRPLKTLGLETYINHP